MVKTLQELTRPNIWRLKPYSSARDEYNGAAASVFLDANENPYNMPHNRYPDPMQRELKTELSRIKKVSPDSIFLGNGSDEAIDLVFRAFCEPRVDNVVAVSYTHLDVYKRQSYVRPTNEVPTKYLLLLYTTPARRMKSILKFLYQSSASRSSVFSMRDVL